MKMITKTLIATSLTIAFSLAAQQQSSQSSPAQTPSSSDKSSADKSSSSSDKSTSSSSDASSSDKSKGGTESQSESTAGSQSSQTITSLQQLSTAGSDPISLQGKRVNLKEAKVQQVLGQDAITVTSDEPGKEILVKSQSPVESVKAGQTVSIMGSVRSMPQDPSQLGIDQTAAQKIQGQKFYIQARQVKPSEQQP